MSRKRKKNRVQSVPRPLVTHRMNENLRGFPLGAELALQRLRQGFRRRQFDTFQHHKEFDDEFTATSAETVPTRTDGTSAHIIERVSGKPLSARSRFSDPVPEETLPPVHAYFQERPETITVCARRQERRSVLFALRRTRKGSAAGKKHEWTELSKVRCS